MREDDVVTMTKEDASIRFNFRREPGLRESLTVYPLSPES